MKVLYFHQHFSTPDGATGIRSYAMARRLLQRGHEVTMVCGSYSGGCTGLDAQFINGVRYGIVDGIKIIEFQLKYSNGDSFYKRTKTFLLFALNSIKVVFREKYDLLFATSTPLTAALPGIVARWLLGKVFIFEVRDLWPELPREMGVINSRFILGIMGCIEWLAYKSSHALIGLSPGIKDGISKHNIDQSRIAMIPNGCDITTFSNYNTKPWRPLGVRDTDTMAIFAGTHGIANGLDSIIDAAIVLKTRGRTDIKLVLIGQGKIKKNLMEIVKNKGLHNVIFHDPVNKDSLAALMASADLGMQVLANVPAFYYGTSPNKFFDYIAAGLPVLNNYPGWVADVITENGCGVVVPPDSPEEFADALEQFSSKSTKPMESAAKHLAKNQFDRDFLANQFVDWLELYAPDRELKK